MDGRPEFVDPVGSERLLQFLFRHGMNGPRKQIPQNNLNEMFVGWLIPRVEIGDQQAHPAIHSQY
ncbi:MAG TPA: hypothetical protein VME43_30320 [Bryobacteraceae bacterium]|nr:hypothetical protein [Bryobacteraceae bacterium]